MLRVGSWVGRINGLLALAQLLRPAFSAHFDCSSGDDVKGEVQDASGYVCSTRCTADSFTCPNDVPAGTSAQPQCMLQDLDKGNFCGLLCQVDSQCPNGARCRQMKQVEVGLCLFPISFSDWARQANNRKFNVGWPQKPGGGSVTPSSASFQIAKTYAALQSLKSKYSIDDGDADMLVLKELLSSMTAASSVAATPIAGGGGSSRQSGAGGGGSQGPFGTWRHDISQFEGYMSEGVPGIQREIHDTVWNIEHIYNYGVACTLLRGIVLLGFAYVSIGSFFKYQMGARGIEMIPHASFWMEYPNLVNDGVIYTKILLGMQASSQGDFLSGGVGRGGSGAFETL
jgi:hypothetical protein